MISLIETVLTDILKGNTCVIFSFLYDAEAFPLKASLSYLLHLLLALTPANCSNLRCETAVKMKNVFYFWPKTWKPMPSKTMDLMEKTRLHHIDKPFRVWSWLGLWARKHLGNISVLCWDFVEIVNSIWFFWISHVYDIKKN